ncbi:MAG: hypothetical protein ACRD6U_08775 [Nitrososphaeraceae archaeon]|jgi:hypothetical protein
MVLQLFRKEIYLPFLLSISLFLIIDISFYNHIALGQNGDDGNRDSKDNNVREEEKEDDDGNRDSKDNNVREEEKEEEEDFEDVSLEELFDDNNDDGNRDSKDNNVREEEKEEEEEDEKEEENEVPFILPFNAVPFP